MLRDRLFLIQQGYTPIANPVAEYLSGDTDVFDFDMIKADDGSILLQGYKVAASTAFYTGIIKRSTDGGVNWTTALSLNDGNVKHQYRARLIKLASGKILSLGAGTFIKESTDHGASWSTSAATIPAAFTGGGVQANPVLRAGLVTAAGTVLIGGMSTYNVGCIMRSTDNASSFSAVYDNDVNRFIAGFWECGDRIFAVSWNTANSKLLESTDDGANWSVKSTLSFVGNVDTIIRMPGTDTILVSRDGSVCWRSVDLGINFTQPQGGSVRALTLFYEKLVFNMGLISHLYKATDALNTTSHNYDDCVLTTERLFDNGYQLGTTLYLPSWTGGSVSARHMYKMEL